MELALAMVGIGGTLLGALAAQALSNRAEADRRRAEDQTRWLGERRRIGAAVVAASLSLERELWSAAAQLDRAERAERIPGHRSILLTPREGVPPVLDALTRDILVDAVEDAFEALNTMEVLVAEVGLVGTTEEAGCADAMLEALWDAAGLLETFARFDSAADAVQEARARRAAFVEVARAALRVDDAADSSRTRKR